MKPTVSITKQCFLFCFCLCWIVKEFSSQSWQFFLFDVNLFLPVFCPLHYKLSTEASHEMKNKARHKSFIQFNYLIHFPTVQYSLLSCLSLLKCLCFLAVFPPLLFSFLCCLHSLTVVTPSCIHSSAVFTPQLLHSSAVFTSQHLQLPFHTLQLSSLLNCLHFLAVFSSQLFLLRSCLHSSDVFIP